MICKVCGKSVRGRPSPTGVCPACRRSEAATMVRPAPRADTEADESSDDAESDDASWPPEEVA